MLLLLRRLEPAALLAPLSVSKHFANTDRLQIFSTQVCNPVHFAGSPSPFVLSDFALPAPFS